MKRNWLIAILLILGFLLISPALYAQNISLSLLYPYITSSKQLTITGTGFGSQNKVELCNVSACNDVTPDQTINSWTDTSISITTVITGLSDGTVYLRVQNGDLTYSEVETLTLDTIVPTITSVNKEDGATLDGAVLYKHDSLIITIPADTCINNLFGDGTTHAVTVEDSGNNDLWSTVKYSIEDLSSSGKLRITPNEDGWPTASTYKVKVGTTYQDCAGNFLASPYAMATGFTVSANISDGPTLITTTASGLGLPTQNRVIWDGERYWAFIYNGSALIPWSSADRINWTSGSSVASGIGSDLYIDVDKMSGWPLSLIPCIAKTSSDCGMYRWDFASESELTALTPTDNTCTATTLYNSVEFGGATPYLAYATGGATSDIKWCKSASGNDINFSITPGEIKNISARVDFPHLKNVGDGTNNMIVCYQWVYSGSNYNIECAFYDQSVSTWGNYQNVTTAAFAYGHRVIVTEDYINIIYKKYADNTLYMKQRGKAPTDTWGTETSIVTVNSSSRLTGTATSAYGNKMILFYIDSSDNTILKSVVYNGSSWGTPEIVADMSVAISINLSTLETVNNDIPVLFQTSGGTYVKFVSRSITGSAHNPGAKGKLITQTGTGFGIALLRYLESYGGITCATSYISRIDRAIQLYCLNHQTTVDLGTAVVSSSRKNYDSHIDANIGIDSNGYAYILYGGRYTSWYDASGAPLMYRKTLLPINNSYFRPYMMHPEVNTGYTSGDSLCTRGYKYPLISSTGVLHIICQDNTTIQVGNNSSGTFGALTTLVDATCIGANTKTYINDAVIDSTGAFHLLWTHLQAGTSQGDGLFYAKCTYSGSYGCKKIDGTIITLPVKPTSCTTNKAEQIWTGYNDGTYGSSDLVLSTDNYPYIVFHKEDTSGQTYSNDMMFAYYDYGNVASGSCAVNFRCISVQEGGSQLQVDDPLAVSRINRNGYVAYTRNGNIARKKVTLTGAFPSDIEATIGGEVVLVSDITYSLALREAVDDRGAGSSFMVVYKHGISRPDEYYIKTLSMISPSLFPLLYRSIMGD